MILNKQKTALVNAYIHQQDTEVSRFMFAAPFITDTDYNDLMDELDECIDLSNNDELYGTNEDNSQFQFTGIDPAFPTPKR